MRRIIYIAFVLFTSVGVFAQEKTIQKAEFDKMLNTSFRLLSDKAHRITETSDTRSFLSQKSPPLNVLSSKDITEVLPGVGRHSIYESNSYVGKKNVGKKKREFFSIGEKHYNREGEGIWLVRIIKGAAEFQFPSHTLNKVDSAEKYKEYKFLGNEILNTQNTKVYSVTRKNQPANPKINSNIVRNSTCKYWFGKDGILSKSECKTEHYSLPKESSPLVITHSIKLYELDPKIKITTPKIN